MRGLGTTIKVLNKAVKAGLGAASDAKAPGQFVAGGYRVRCAHCQGEVFSENLAGIGLVLNNLSKSRFLVCVNCTHVMMFGAKIHRLKPPVEKTAKGGESDAKDSEKRKESTDTE